MIMGEIASKIDILRIKALADFLYGAGAGEALLKGKEIRVVKSKSTGRIKNVYVDGKLIASIRASDGFLILSLEGAKRLLAANIKEKIVVVSDDAAPFIAKGRTLFAKHVIDVSPSVRAGDEVIVVNKKGNLLALGKAVLSSFEMKRFKRGIAVKIRKGVLSSH